MADTKLEQMCIARNWTCVQFAKVYVDEIFDELMSVLNEKYCIIPSFDGGYDDALTSKIYFQSQNDAWAFKVMISSKLPPTIGYYQFIHDDAGFTQVIIVDKAFYDEHNMLNGDGLSEEAEDARPDGFFELAACCYEHDYSSDTEAKQELIEAGFVEKELFN